MRLISSATLALALGLFASTFGGCAESDKDGGTSEPGCSAAPDCGECGTCYDLCVCNGSLPDACLNQCSGSGGSGGSGNAGGSAGNTSGGSAQGGSAQGGSAQGGSSGSGGGTSCDAAVEFTTPACGDCGFSFCCNQLVACFGVTSSSVVPDCAYLNQCLAENCQGATTDEEFSACAQSSCSEFLTQDAVDSLNNMGTCLTNSCSAQCG